LREGQAERCENQQQGCEQSFHVTLSFWLTEKLENLLDKADFMIKESQSLMMMVLPRGVFLMYEE
jgi:putative IMPACT (imprinted ancient) family translation regulator